MSTRTMSNQVWKDFAEQEVSHSVAHYLMTILDLQASHGYARVSDVARELDLTKGSVSLQLKNLKERGFVTEDDNRFLHLTPDGDSVARDVRCTRKVLVSFLGRILGIASEDAEKDACKIEHLLSSRSSRRILALVQFLLTDDPAVRQFLERFQDFQPVCPTPQACTLCEGKCRLDDAVPARRARGQARPGRGAAVG